MLATYQTCTNAKHMHTETDFMDLEKQNEEHADKEQQRHQQRQKDIDNEEVMIFPLYICIPINQSCLSPFCKGAQGMGQLP